VQPLPASVNAAAAITLGSVFVAFAVAVLSRRVAVAPGSGEQRWFSLVVLTSAVYALCDLPTTLPGSPGLVFLFSGFEVAALALTLWAWIRFSQEFVSVAPGRAERLVSGLVLGAVPFLALPGVAFSPAVVDRPFPPLGVVYRQSLSTPLGDAVFVALLLVGAAVLVRLVRAARRGLRHAGAIALAYAIMLAFALCDALTTSFVLPLPFLLDWGFAAPVLAVGWMNTSRLVDSARALERLRGELETQAQARTLELSRALERLHQSEKLAALGRFANGVAHEVNNPAAVVTASLSHLAAGAAERLGPDELEALADAREGMRQITSLVRRLGDAGRITSPPGLAVAQVSAAIANVVQLQPEAVRARLSVDAGAAGGACVRLRPDALEGALEALVRNAVDATPPDLPQPLEIRAEQDGDRVRITVVDHGTGMDPDVLGRAFDPFFTTKPEGRGAGLGLAVARGLVQASGGTLRLESAPGTGTRAILELPLARPPAAPEAEPP
jgi:signal transduction histidine kinase